MKVRDVLKNMIEGEDDIDCNGYVEWESSFIKTLPTFDSKRWKRWEYEGTTEDDVWAQELMNNAHDEFERQKKELISLWYQDEKDQM